MGNRKQGIQRDSGATSQLLSGRRSRVNTNWAEPRLVLNVNSERILHKTPLISSNGIRKYSKYFTVSYDELAVAKQFLYPVDVENNASDGLTETEDMDPAT